MYKKMIVIALSAVVFINSSLCFASEIQKFKDIKNHWAEESINNLINMNIVSGYPNGQFKPNELISRGAFVKMLISAMGYELKSDETFSDTAKNWSDPYVDTAVVNNIIPLERYGQSFLPEAPMPRFEMSEIICKALSLDGDLINKPFQDTTDPFANKLYSEYIIRGNYKNGKTYFMPNSTMTRAEASMVINSIIKYRENADAFKLQKQVEDKINKQVQAGSIAKPDYNFENFISSESAATVISQDTVKAKDGILMFYSEGGKWGNYKDGYVASNAKVKNLNVYVYNLVKELTYFAQKNNMYVKVLYIKDGEYIYIGLFDSKFYADAPLGRSLLRVSLEEKPIKVSDYQFTYKYLRAIVWNTSILYPRLSDYYQNGGTLANMQKMNFRTPEMTALLNRLFNVVYGTTDGNKLFAFHLKAYDKDKITKDTEYKEKVYINGYEISSYYNNGMIFGSNLK